MLTTPAGRRLLDEARWLAQYLTHAAAHEPSDRLIRLRRRANARLVRRHLRYTFRAY